MSSEGCSWAAGVCWTTQPPPPTPCSWWRISGMGRLCAGSSPDLCYCHWWASVRNEQVRGATKSPLVVVAGVWAGLPMRAVRPKSLLLRLVGFGQGCTGAPGPCLWLWRMSGWGRTGARSRPNVYYCGWWALIGTSLVHRAAQAPLLVVADVWDLCFYDWWGSGGTVQVCLPARAPLVGVTGVSTRVRGPMSSPYLCLMV